MTIVARKFKILSKRTVRGSALVTISDTKQGFTVPRGRPKCMEIGLCNLCKLLYVFTALYVQNPTYQVDSLKKEIIKKVFSRADSLVDKILSCPRIKLSNSQTLISDGVETGNSLLDFPQQLRRRNADIPHIYFTLLDAAGVSPTLIVNQNVKAKERGSWVPFKM